MAASLKQDYGKIREAGADLIMISPDSREQHRNYALALFGAELPYHFVSDANLAIARRYGLMREVFEENSTAAGILAASIILGVSYIVVQIIIH